MENSKKSILLYYLTEFVFFTIGLGILVALLWIENFQFSLRTLSIWVLIFNAILFSFWLWKSKVKIWEKGAALIYFLLIEYIIINAIKFVAPSS